MRPVRSNPWLGVILILGVALTLAFAGTATVWRKAQVGVHTRHVSVIASDLAGNFLNFFTSRYPANHSFQSELEKLRTDGRLTSENEALIRKATLSVSTQLKMPPAILWCLLFQESRLDHLSGLAEGKGVTGLGQFTFSSFYEVNFHLDRYGLENREMMIKTMGNDVRPVGAFKSNLTDPSSYYNIPTAVASTGSYLNNRYHQLEQALMRKKVSYDRDLLWLYAAMAYNKGGRTVIALWNDAAERGGKREVERMVSDRVLFFHSMRDEAMFERVLAHIWPEENVPGYARELRYHVERIRDCAIADEQQLKFRDPAFTKKEVR